MKKVCIVITALLSVKSSSAQFTVGSQGITIMPNTTVYIDSLKIDNYNSPFIISNNTLQVSYETIPGSDGNNSIAKVYQFTNPIAFRGTLGLYYDDADLGANVETNLQVAYQTQAGGAWTTTTNSVVAASVNYVYSPAFNNNLYRATAVSSGVVLPIHLLSFDAYKEEHKVLLEWKTASEQNNDRFIIERSPNGKDFTTLAVQKTKAIDGNSSEELIYRYEDSQPFPDNFYRLRQIDKNGNASYSPVRFVSFDAGKISVNIYPNPATDQLYVNMHGYTGNSLTAVLTDMNGRTVLNMVYTIQSSGAGFEIPLHGIAAGIYHLSILDGQHGIIVRSKIVKQ